MRLYPDKTSPTDTTNRRLIRVRATLTAPVRGITVYFKSFDLDDPSTDSSPVDTNGNAGNDNRGSPGNGQIRDTVGGAFTSGTLVMFSSATGVAQSDLQVTTHPGDNFAVAAGRAANALAKLPTK